MRLFLVFLCLPFISFAQTDQLPPLEHEQLVSWNRIESKRIAHDGSKVMYTLRAEEGNPTLVIADPQTGEQNYYPRGRDGHFSADSRYAVFLKGPHQDSLKALRRAKTEEEDLPKDTLVILDLQTGTQEQLARIQSYQLPDKWPGWLAYWQEPALPDTTTQASDSTKVAEPKKENKKNGSLLHLLRLRDGQVFELGYVTHYQHAKEAAGWIARSTGDDSLQMPGIYYFPENGTAWQAVFTDSLGHFGQMAISEQGDQLAFLTHNDTTEARIPPFELHLWQNGWEASKMVADPASDFLEEGWILNQHQVPYFSEDGSRLFFGLSPEPILQDTALLPEEIVQVEVWHWQDTWLYPQQMVQLDKEKKKAWMAYYQWEDDQVVWYQQPAYRSAEVGEENNGQYAIVFDERNYYQSVSWAGFPALKDLSSVDLNNGQTNLLAEGIKGTPRMSPGGQYAYWYDYADTAWHAIHLPSGQRQQLTENERVNFYYELHDTPSDPGAYGIAGWLENDRMVIIYDRFDLWLIDPKRPEVKHRMTEGRDEELVHRYLRLDPERKHIEADERILLMTFSEKTKLRGYAWLDMASGEIEYHNFEGYNSSRRPLKARDSDVLVYSLENFETFPDLLAAGPDFDDPVTISDANPQQTDFAWGTMEIVEWTSLDGQSLQGMLVKPANFDPSKKYPLIVNFYERSSQGLYNHRAPYPHRSTINYSFYASRGYVIFNPDVPYRIGYPGESAYNAVLSGVTHLLDRGFVDAERMALQGHSWGGYQVAYILTKTDMFRCAESGAPVVNMTSAYGGIRWGSGLSRMFQYEHTQSRIGGTLWETPLRYLENSPLFFTDKIQTPVLILHNDKDGAVPWYQGIEWFVALRRLGKPAWMLNYNDEPHWPVKLQNRKDFNIRMAQFFDYYLQDAPMPQWMDRGVPAQEKGILQGLEPAALED